jgi:serine/threonine-protein kinase ATR
MTCRICDDSHSPTRENQTYWNSCAAEEDWKDTLAALLEITRMEEFEQSPKPRVLMAFAISRIFNHISDAAYLDMQNCDLAKWLLASMSRSQREVRIAAVYVANLMD